MRRYGQGLVRVDHLNEVKHGGTEATETHGEPWREPNVYREAAMKARTDLLERGLRRVLESRIQALRASPCAPWLRASTTQEEPATTDQTRP
jgi:hypothetical protein